MTDRELLELAAKAYGVPVELRWFGPAGEHLEPDCWNPLDGDGDAFRLAQSLCMRVECSKGYQQVSVYGRDFTITEPTFDGRDNPANWDEDERRAATRRAIVRAAAEIGKALEVRGTAEPYTGEPK